MEGGRGGSKLGSARSTCHAFRAARGLTCGHASLCTGSGRARSPGAAAAGGRSRASGRCANMTHSGGAVGVRGAMAEAVYRTPGLGHAAGQWARAASCLAFCALTSACLGGPHPVPPWEKHSSDSSPQSLPTVTTGFGTAGTGAAVTGNNGTDSAQNPVISTAGVGTSAPPPLTPASSAAGSGVTSTVAGTGGSATGAAGASASPPSSGAAGEPGCQGALSLARGTAPDNVLFLVDRSADMAGDFQGQPRWQQSDSALVSAITPLTAAALKIGVLFYPSAAGAAPACVGPAWLCPAPTTAETTCGVSAMGSNDQVALQPAMQALAALARTRAVRADQRHGRAAAREHRAREHGDRLPAHRWANQRGAAGECPAQLPLGSHAGQQHAQRVAHAT